MKNYFCLLTFIILPVCLFSQTDFMNFGKINETELQSSVCPIDSFASAYVIGDFGISRFNYDNTDGFTISFDRHVRIKILDKEAFDKANFNIYLYKTLGGDDEKLLSIRGFTYNFSGSEIEKTKFEKSNFVTENIDKNNDVIKVTLPNVKNGSIVELSYTVKSPFIFNLNSWNFQDDIPTIRSEYHVFVPEYFNYKNWTEGYEPIIKKEDKKSERFTYYEESEIEPGMGGGRTSGGMREFNAMVYHWTYIAENIKAFKNEPFITTPSDYLSAVKFELISRKYPWEPVKSYTRTWEDINRTLNEEENFGIALKRTGHLNKVSQKIAASSTGNIQKTVNAYNHIKNEMGWDGKYQVFTVSSLANSYEKRTGNSADINLNLVALCKTLGLDVYPVVVSTRNHGKIRPAQPILTQFNHVIAAVQLDGKYLLLDATDPNCPFDLLPSQCLNQQGRLIDEKGGFWVDLNSKRPYEETIFANLEIDANNLLTGTFSFKASDYAAIQQRKKFRMKTTEEDFIKEFENEISGVELFDYKIDNVDSIEKPFVVNSKIKFIDPVNTSGNILFLSPKLFEAIENNFKSVTREYPVDYNYPIRLKVTININLPEGYTVEEIPASVNYALPESKGKYTYSIKNNGRNIQFLSIFHINQTIFPGTEYHDLKQFYSMIVAKEAEQMVIKVTN